MKNRMVRVNELLKRSISEIIRKELTFEKGLITVSDVKVSPDLKNATVYFGVIGKDASAEHEALKALMGNRSKIQALMSKDVVIKYTPHLKFVLDTSIERGVRVLQILDDIGLAEPESDEDENNQPS
ncbi:MAG: 30S ribosome-binding factor RbfA [Verrucomicrobiota bacterium]|nr:30S ribosome-binding factor RbfA [Verrucomicrobiota bacterium]